MSIEWKSKTKAKLRISVGSGQNRKTYTKTVEVHGKKEAQKLHKEFEEQIRSIGSAPEKINVKELIDWYLDHCKSIGIKPTTLRGYETCNKRIIEAIGRVNALDLTTYQVSLFVRKLSKKYSPKTIRNTISLLSASYDYGIKMKAVIENPCRNVDLPKKQQKEIKTYSSEEIKLFMQALENETLDIKVAYELALFCGLRRSEICAIKYEDVNIPWKTLRINKARHRIPNEGDYETTTKTASSSRLLSLPDFLIEDISELNKKHEDSIFESSEYLIQNEFGEAIAPGTLTDIIRRINEEYDLSKVTLHGLRHTCATLLASKGISMAEVSQMLGHSSISTTLNIYTHIFGDSMTAGRRISGVMEELVDDFEGKKEGQKIKLEKNVP